MIEASCHVLTLVPFYVSVLGWLGRELGWAFYVFVLCFVFLLLAWYGSQSEAAVNRGL